MSAIILTFGCAFIVLATILSSVRATAWWVRLFDFPRLQIAGLGVILLALVAFFATPAGLKAALAAGLLGALAFQAFKIWRYTPLAGYESLEAGERSPGAFIRLLISNVLMGNRESAPLLRHIRERDPDLVLLLEPDSWWEEQFKQIESTYPYSIKCPLDNTYGMLLYSRLRLSEIEVNYLLLPDIPSFFSQVELRDGHLVHLHCLHPLPPSVSVSTTHRDAELVLVGRRVRGERTPCIVAGDLNDVAWSYTTTLFQKISGMLDPRKGRGFYNTYHARWPVARWPLDHLFHSPSFRFVELERLSPVGSDHFPILAGLSFEPEGADRQSPPELNPEDREIARRKLRKAGEEGLTDG